MVCMQFFFMPLAKPSCIHELHAVLLGTLNYEEVDPNLMTELMNQSPDLRHPRAALAEGDCDLLQPFVAVQILSTHALKHRLQTLESQATAYLERVVNQRPQLASSILQHLRHYRISALLQCSYSTTRTCCHPQCHPRHRRDHHGARPKLGTSYKERAGLAIGRSRCAGQKVHQPHQ